MAFAATLLDGSPFRPEINTPTADTAPSVIDNRIIRTKNTDNSRFGIYQHLCNSLHSDKCKLLHMVVLKFFTSMKYGDESPTPTLDQFIEMTPGKRNLPTLEDVAAAARVSTATVSRCLNEPDKVSEKTRDRVMATVAKLHYSPNFGARAIAANRTGIFGAVIPTMENAIFARGIEAFQNTLVEKNATTLVASSAYDLEREAQQIRTMVARGADGLLLIGTDRDAGIYDFLNQRNIPVVIAWAYSADNAQSCVGFNNRTASRQLVESAIRMGHKSFAYISAPTRSNDRARDRVLGAQQAIARSGMDAAAMPVIETKYSIRNGRNAFNQIAEAGAVPSLVICGNDVLAVGAIQAAKDAGLTVPGDVSIIGFDDIELATVISPALTTVHVPHRQMGQRAAETLFDLVRGVEERPVKIEVETRIVERVSLAPPSNQ